MEPTLGKSEKRRRKQLSRERQVKIFRRDDWLCHLCRRPVIFAPALKYLQRELAEVGHSGLAYWRYAYSREFAPLLDELAAVLDHVNPHAGGGTGSEENLKTACNKCNPRKNDANYTDWVRQNPSRKIRGKEPHTWDGLTTLFIYLAQCDRASLTQTERQWLKALEKP